MALDGFKASPPAAEADLAPVQALLNDAYQGEAASLPACLWVLLRAWRLFCGCCAAAGTADPTQLAGGQRLRPSWARWRAPAQAKQAGS